ncbi:MAG TPA: FlgD immunoglobulin-like domain containing protein [Verrucomicrobiae bacterium]|nr:FlgD immunoglobulin-like domain containing protein [Verrucomicrobiae bacterium]
MTKGEQYRTTPVLDINAGCTQAPCPDVPPSNRIYRAGTSSKAVKNTTSYQVKAEQNWWGTSSPSASFFEGSVDWNPYLTSDPGPYWRLGTKEEKTTRPLAFSLGQNYPNPFNPTTTISFSLPKAEKVKLKIYNLLGQEVLTLVDGEKPAGTHQIVWNGRDENGTAVASGIYFYKLETASFKEVKRMIFLK